MGQNNGLKSSTNRRQLLSKPGQKNPRLSAAVGLKREKKNHSLFLDRCRPRGEGAKVCAGRRVETDRNRPLTKHALAEGFTIVPQRRLVTTGSDWSHVVCQVHAQYQPRPVKGHASALLPPTSQQHPAVPRPAKIDQHDAFVAYFDADFTRVGEASAGHLPQHLHAHNLFHLSWWSSVRATDWIVSKSKACRRNESEPPKTAHLPRSGNINSKSLFHSEHITPRWQMY